LVDAVMAITPVAGADRGAGGHRPGDRRGPPFPSLSLSSRPSFSVSSYTPRASAGYFEYVEAAGSVLDKLKALFDVATRSPRTTPPADSGEPSDG